MSNKLLTNIIIYFSRNDRSQRIVRYASGSSLIGLHKKIRVDDSSGKRARAALRGKSRVFECLCYRASLLPIHN